MICCFDSNLRAAAEELIRNIKELSDAKSDVQYLEQLICTPYYQLDWHEIAHVDQTMKRKYKEIAELKILANSVKWITLPSNGRPQPNVPEIEELKFDRFGIFVHVLKKFNKIDDLAEFFDKNYIAL